MIDRGHSLALTTQARLLGIARSTVYRAPQPVSPTDLAVMRRIDELHLNHPFAGSRMLSAMLVNEGITISRTHVRTLMRRTGIEPCIGVRGRASRCRGTKSTPIATRRVGGPTQCGERTHLHPDGQRLRLPRCSTGLVQPPSLVLTELPPACPPTARPASPRRQASEEETAGPLGESETVSD